MTKAKKKQLSETIQKNQKQTKKKNSNPFEIHINKNKQNVLGQKSKVDKGLPGISRAKAIKKRKNTLLQEYKLHNKSNVFLDKRIGEKNFSMSEEDKAMARFAAERIKNHKKQSIFNLNDDEKLTHRGQTLEEIEKFDDPRSDDEFSDNENQGGKLGAAFTDEVHFGGGTLSKAESGKSRKDIIEQLIAESKKRKAEKQKIREQTQDLTEKLDTEWKDLLPVVSAANKKLEEVTETKKTIDPFDLALRQLKFEPRGMPSDKLRSEDEIIQEEKERLEALEKDRLTRMKGFINGPNATIKHKSADDLDDGFVVVPVKENEEDQDKGKNEDLGNDEDNDTENNSELELDTEDERHEVHGNEIVDNEMSENEVKEEIEKDNQPSANDEKESAKSDSELGDSTDDLSDLKESDSSSDEENQLLKKTVTFKENGHCTGTKPIELKSILKTKTDTNSVQPERPSKDEIRQDLLKRKEIMEQARKELPYTYKAPESFEELQGFLQNQNPEYQAVIVDRIIKCNHWTLNGANKEKMSNLFLYLLHHINDYVTETSSENIAQCFQLFDRLAPFMYDLAHINPENTKMFVQELIKEKHQIFEKNKKSYPNLDTLILFKLVSLLFPTSDFRHPIVTPCLIFMSQILLRSRVKNRTDISKGLFICTLILEYIVLSKRFSPAAINFLRGVIYTATPKHLIQGMRVISPFKTAGELSNLLLITDSKDINKNIDPSTIRMKAEDLLNDQMDDDFKIRALVTAINLLKEFKTNLEELDAAYVIFEPILKLLHQNTFETYATEVRNSIKELQTSLQTLKDKKLEYLVIEKKKPKPLRMYEPRIERVYDGKNHRTMSKEKAEREKLLHKYKKEMKGAMREIRRDRAFLAKVQIKQQIKGDIERKRKVKEIFGDAAVQQSEFKKMKRKK